MNLQKYGSAYAAFHGAPSFEIIQDDVVVLPFADTTKIRSIVLKIRYFDRVVERSKTPFVSALKAFHKTDAVDTAFVTEETSSILLGNDRLVYPTPAGTFRMCATPFFLRDPGVVPHVLDGIARTPRENVYLYRNAVLYLDDADVPRPGEAYLDHHRDGAGLFRICLLTSEPREAIEKICAEWRHRREVLTMPFRSLPTEADVSKFLRPTPAAEARFPDCKARGTALVHRRLSVSRPGFLIQDVLNSYRTNGGSLRDLGLFVEHPLAVSHDGLSRRAVGAAKRFLALSVNGNMPTRVLLVRCPYERYTEYSHVPPVAWTSVLYDDRPLPQHVGRVTVDSTILGYRHGRTFLCLGHPMLAATALYPNLNGSALLDRDPGFDPRADRHLEVVETYPLDPDGRRLLHRVKHRSLDNELWCSSEPKVPSKRDYARRARPPPLVEWWLRFADRNEALGAVDHGDLDVVKLALILSRHRVCYSMRRGSSGARDVRFEGTGQVVFEMDEAAIDFINDLRLDGYRDAAAAAATPTSEAERCSVS